MESQIKSLPSVPEVQVFMRLRVKTGEKKGNGKPRFKSVFCSKTTDMNHVHSETDAMRIRLLSKIEELLK